MGIVFTLTVLSMKLQSNPLGILTLPSLYRFFPNWHFTARIILLRLYSEICRVIVRVAPQIALALEEVEEEKTMAVAQDHIRAEPFFVPQLTCAIYFLSHDLRFRIICNFYVSNGWNYCFLKENDN